MIGFQPPVTNWWKVSDISISFSSKVPKARRKKSV
jgi:hypothetical protein